MWPGCRARAATTTAWMTSSSARTFRLQPLEQPVLRGSGWVARPTVTFLCPAAYGMALGLAERAIQEVTEIASTRVRLGSRAPLAEREIFQLELGEIVVATRAIRGHGVQLFRELADAPVRDVADASREAGRHGAQRGGLGDAHRGIGDPHRPPRRRRRCGLPTATTHLQRLLREIQTVSQHVIVADGSFQRVGRHALGLPVRPGL